MKRYVIEQAGKFMIKWIIKMNRIEYNKIEWVIHK